MKNAIQKLAHSAQTKYAALGTALAVPALALANDPAPHEAAVTAINGMKTGVNAVGAAVLGITLTIVAFLVIKRMAKGT